MFTKLAGRLSLKDLVSNVIEETREKIASSDEKNEKKDEKKEEKVKKLVSYENKEHGHIPTPKEEEAEKKASALVLAPGEEVEKLASALEQLGEQFEKDAADEQNHGSEFKGGGETLAVMKAVPGKQSNTKDSSKSHNVPMTTSSQKGDGGGPAPTQVKNDHDKRPGGAPFPKKGVMKTAGSSVLDKIRAAAGKKGEEKKEKDEKGEKEDASEKKASTETIVNPVDFILGKIANVEKKMGGETLDSKSGEGPKPPSGGTNSARSMISSNEAATNAKKVQAKAPQKKLMAEVLTEPMQSKAHDHKVSENLRNATKGGVKIAAAREFLKKIASEGCTCEGKGECKHCKMKKAMEKKSAGGMPSTGASGVGSSMPAGPLM